MWNINFDYCKAVIFLFLSAFSFSCLHLVWRAKYSWNVCNIEVGKKVSIYHISSHIKNLMHILWRTKVTPLSPSLEVSFDALVGLLAII